MNVTCWGCNGTGTLAVGGGRRLCGVCGGASTIDDKKGPQRQSPALGNLTDEQAIDDVMWLGADAPPPIEFPKRYDNLYQRTVRVVRAFYQEHEGLMRFRPRTVFRPHALLLFGVSKGSHIEMLHSCNIVLVDGVDSRVFTLLKFHDWMKDGCLVNEQEAAEVPERCKFGFNTLNPSTDIQLQHTGSIESATLFGEELRRD